MSDQFSKKIIYGLTGLYFLSSLLTLLNNTEALTFGPVQIPGLGPRDLITMTFQCMVFLVPFFVAQKHLSTPESHRILLGAFMAAGLFYSLLVLFEVRMSPQLHTWVYGYFQHGFAQHIRGGSFRPIVFMQHGLWVGILLLTCTMSAFILFKEQTKASQPRLQYLFAGFWLLGVLLISRNFGATLLAGALIPILWFFRVRIQIWVSVSVMIIFLIFPVLRQTEVLTFDRIQEFVGSISVARQQSFQHRLDNEALFLERAAQKPITGWGLWGRWRIHDPVTGKDVSTADGIWMIVLGERGWIGYIAYFGLLTGPVLLLLRARKRRQVPIQTAGLSIIMASTIIYQVPNDTIGPMTLLIAGALAGFVLKSDEDAEDTPKTALHPQKQRNRYTRFPAVKTQANGRYVARG